MAAVVTDSTPRHFVIRASCMPITLGLVFNRRGLLERSSAIYRLFELLAGDLVLTAGGEFMAVSGDFTGKVLVEHCGGC
jgi:hypothetical protein